MNLVSVIVVTKNHSRYLAKCLNSILGQTYQKFEIIIVDHNSTDNTADIINSYRSEKIKYFHYSENKGIANLRNFGIKQSKGDYVFFY